MIVYNTDLYRVLGIQFEFKRVWDEQLPMWVSMVDSYDETGNTPELREELAEKIIECGPSMGFAFKQYSYELISLIDQAGRDLYSASPAALERLDKSLQSVQNSSGVEGEEDYNFMVALFRYFESFIYAFD
jgi:hypothetical protein